MSYVVMAFRNLRRRKLRTGLTLLGIVVGVSLMVALFAIGEGMNQRMTTMMRSLGGADITVYNTSGTRGRSMSMSGDPLSESLIADVQAIPGVEIATGLLTGFGEVNKNQTYVVGIDPEPHALVTGGLNVVEGRTLQPSDIHDYGAVIGVSLAEELEVTLGSHLKTKVWGGAADAPWISFTIVGIAETGNPREDRGIFVHLSNAQYILQSPDSYGAGERHINRILVKTEDPEKAEDVAKQIEATIEGVRVFVAKQMLQRIQETTGTLILFLEGIGSVAIVAGCIGIMNTMIMSVFERTREIGTLKAIGAKDRDILIIILTEATLIGILAGAIGCAVGAAGTLLLGSLTEQTARGANPMTITPIITLEILLNMFGMGVLVGVLAGIYPAWRASRLDPVEALKHV